MNSLLRYAGLLLLMLPLVVAAKTGEKLFSEQCSSCHKVSDEQNDSLKYVWDRKGPDLSYAGNKYNAKWINGWLQSPQRIRPAGMFYANHIKATPDGDVIDETTFKPHVKLSAADAETLTQYLMTLKARSDLIKAGDYQVGTISQSMGEMLFDKFRGCLACHQIEPGYGGFSGPEVYTATIRLQEDFLVSFMRKPQAWDKRTLMPDKHLKEADLQKFVHYFHVLAETGDKQ